MKYYVTKYCLTSGDILKKGLKNTHFPDMKQLDGCHYVFKKDFYKTEEAAMARAEDTRSRKIACLRRQISRLEKLSFRIVEQIPRLKPRLNDYNLPL